MAWSKGRATTLGLSICCIVFVVAAIITIIVHSALDDDQPVDSLLSAEFVHDALQKGSPKLCIVDATFDREHYRRGHISESALYFNQSHAIFNVTLSAFISTEEFREFAQNMRIQDDCIIVIYDRGEGSSGQLNASFVWWIFKIYGHKAVSVLDGGLSSWIAASYDLKTGYPKEIDMTFYHPQMDNRFLVQFDEVNLLVNSNHTDTNHVLLDVRSSGEFNAANLTADAIYKGHIKNAKNLPIDSFFTVGRKFVLVNDTELLLSDVGVTRDKSVIVYGRNLTQASAAFLAIQRAGYSVRMFPGGWIEYTNKQPK